MDPRDTELSPRGERVSVFAKAKSAVARLGGWRRRHGNKDSTSSPLGSDQLGRFAHEKQMPPWLMHHLEKNGQISRDGVIDDLRTLFDESKSTECAYFCESNVQRVSKLKHEGGFCGYRNIQMLASYIILKDGEKPIFGTCIPTIFDIQNLIEQAWDKGYSPRGRIETGGIRGTRKYIGTPEVKALFNSLNVPCSVQTFRGTKNNAAITQLAKAIEEYFTSPVSCSGRSSPGLKTVLTCLPPVFFQRHGHSMTIIGLEKTKGGEVNLLVFDPGRLFPDHKHNKSTKIGFDNFAKSEILRSYRLHTKSLLKYNELELL